MKTNKTPIQQVIDSINDSEMEVIKTSAVIEALNLMKVEEKRHIIDAFYEGAKLKPSLIDMEATSDYYSSKYI